MKDLVRVAGVILVGILLVGAVGCSGSDGKDGQPGAPGAPGTNVTVVTTPSTSNIVTPAQDLPGIKIAVTSLTGGSGAGGAFLPGDTITVNFTLKKNDGKTLLVSELSSSGIYVSGPTFNYQRVIPRISNFHLSVTTNEDGSYSYTLPSPIPAVYAAPYNDSGKYPDGVLTGQDLLDGTYTVGIHAYRTYYDNTTSYRDVGNSETDFLLGSATTLEPREVVKNDNCNSCHVTLQAHGGSRRDVKLCLLCHTTGGEDGDNVAAIDFRVMIHKLHNASHLPSVQGVQTKADGSRDYAATPAPYILEGTDFSDINFPVFPSMSIAMPKNQGYSALSSAQKTQNDNVRKGVVACDKCHGDPDGAGSKTAPAQGGLCYSQPSRRACGSCHDDINWDYPYVSNGATMPAQGSDGSCILCHVPSGTTFGNTEVHVHPVSDAAINAGLKVNLTAVTGGSGGAADKFLAGDPISVAFTVKNDAGADVPVSSLDSFTAVLVGPTQNRQTVLPNYNISPFDFSGRLQAVATVTTDKGSMSKVAGATASEVLTVLFSSATAFTVTGSTSGALASGTLPASPSTNAKDVAISNVETTAAVVAQGVTVNFTSPTAFDVTGSSSGLLGSGTFPPALANKSTSVKFISTDGTLRFNVAVGTTAITAGNKIYLAIVKGTPNTVRFAVIAGKASFAANDRFYYEAVKESDTSYAVNIPMDIALEYAGDGTGAAVDYPVAHSRMYPGRQSVWAVASYTADGPLMADAPAIARYIDVPVATAIVKGDYVLLDRAVAAKRECVVVSAVTAVGTTISRLTLTGMSRFAHTTAATVDRITADNMKTYQKLEGVDYTYTTSGGNVTGINGSFTAGYPVIITYRTDGRFGRKRSVGDAYQSIYNIVLGDSIELDQSWGKWTGLPLLSGTYTVGLWSYKSIDLTQNGELQTYRNAAKAATKDVLYGTATTVEPREAISSQSNCDACHGDVLFHGGGRRGADACLFCHGESGSGSLAATYDFRTFLHKIHMGKDLTNAATFMSGAFAEIGYPPMPGGAKHCATCHGSDNEAWKTPADRVHASATNKTRSWRAVCGSCHDSDATAAHINLMTDASGTESCSVCHGEGTEQSVELKHKNR